MVGKTRAQRSRRLVVVVVVAALGLFAAGCSEDAQTDFNDENQDGFMAACTEPVEDSRLVAGICQCVFEQIQLQGDFAEFEAIDAELIETPSLELPQQITDFIAQCVIEEAEL